MSRRAETAPWETLFRFSLARAAVEQDADAPRIPISQVTPLQETPRVTAFVADVAELDLRQQVSVKREFWAHLSEDWKRFYALSGYASATRARAPG